MRLVLGVIFLYNVLPRRTRVSRKNDFDIVANFETMSTIQPLVEHLQSHVPGLSGLNIATDGWEERIRGEKVFNLSLIHISEPTRLGMISYAVFCLTKK